MLRAENIFITTFYVYQSTSLPFSLSPFCFLSSFISPFPSPSVLLSLVLLPYISSTFESVSQAAVLSSSLCSHLHEIRAREDAVLASRPQREQSLAVGDDEVVI